MPRVPQNDEDGDGEPAASASLLAGPRNVKPYIARRGEQYMNKEQLEHFARILQNWKRDLMVEVDRTVLHMKDEAANFPDPNDRATQEEEFSLELRTRDRERKLIRKIDEALKRIEDGSYGYCLETGEEIGIKRLEARPVATLVGRSAGAARAPRKAVRRPRRPVPIAAWPPYVGRFAPDAVGRSAPGLSVYGGGELTSMRGRTAAAGCCASRISIGRARSRVRRTASCAPCEAFGFEWDGEVVRQRTAPSTTPRRSQSLRDARPDLRVFLQPPAAGG